MFSRFTDRARRVMQLANREAQRLNHEYIGTEHILLGLIKEGAGVAANVLKNLDIDLHKVRLKIEQIVQSGPSWVTPGKLPMTPKAKKVIEYSIEEARSLNHNYVGTEHLLLGLLREQEGVAAQVLMNLGLELEDVREEVLNLLGQDLKPGAAVQPRQGKLGRLAQSVFGWAKAHPLLCIFLVGIGVTLYGGLVGWNAVGGPGVDAAALVAGSLYVFYIACASWGASRKPCG